MERIDGYYGISSGRRPERNSQTRYRLNVKGRPRRPRRARQPGIIYKIGAVVMLVVTVAIALYGAVRGIGLARDRALPKNDAFIIRQIEVVPGRIKTESLVREYLRESGIKKNTTNLFGFDIRAFRDRYLQLNHVVRDIQLTRILPDTLRVVINERKPLLRMGEREFVACDEAGLMFPVGGSSARLPYVIGGPPKPKPGEQVSDSVMRAIEIVRLCDAQPDEFNFNIYALDVRRDDLVKVYILTPWRIVEGWVSWYGMDSMPTKASRSDLLERMRLLRANIVKYEGQYGTVDVTLSGKVSLRD